MLQEVEGRHAQFLLVSGCKQTVYDYAQCAELSTSGLDSVSNKVCLSSELQQAMALPKASGVVETSRVRQAQHLISQQRGVELGKPTGALRLFIMNGPSARAAIATSGDPRRPELVVHYQQRGLSGDKPPPNVLLLLATGCGVGAMMLKFRELTLLGLVFICSALATADSNFEWSQLISTGMLTFMGLFMSYGAPILQKYQYQQALAKGVAAGPPPMQDSPP